MITEDILGTQKNICMYLKGYAARPVTISQSSGTIVANTEGHYIIPAGTFLKGGSKTLFVDPNQLAQIVPVTYVKAYGTLQSAKINITAKDGGTAGNSISVALVDPGKAQLAPKIAVTGTAIVITLARGATAGSFTTTLMHVVDLINNDIEANSLVVASLVNVADIDVATVAEAAVTLLHGADADTAVAEGILFNDIDVTYGEEAGAMMIAGFVDLDKLPNEPSASIETSLPKITFMRKD